MFIGTVRNPVIQRVWKSWAPLRVKFFTWLALKKRLWTADRRRRHNLDEHDLCWLCDQEAETVDHLLVNCSFTKVIWWNLISWMDCTCSFQGQSQLQTWWDYLRGMQGRDRRRGFDSLFMCIIWAIWKERNKRLFEGTSCTAIGGHTSFELFKAGVVREWVGLLRLFRSFLSLVLGWCLIA